MDKFTLITLIKVILMILFMAAAVFIPMYFAWDYGEKKHNEKVERIENTIGQEVIIQSDTLIVVSYQDGGWGLPCGYVLSNGLVVDEKILINNLEK